MANKELVGIVSFDVSETQPFLPGGTEIGIGQGCLSDFFKSESL